MSALHAKLSFISQGNLKSWLLDKDCNDNYSVIYAGGQQTAIFQNKRNGPELLKSRNVSTHMIYMPSIQVFN